MSKNNNKTMIENYELVERYSKIVNYLILIGKIEEKIIKYGAYNLNDELIEIYDNMIIYADKINRIFKFPDKYYNYNHYIYKKLTIKKSLKLEELFYDEKNVIMNLDKEISNLKLLNDELDQLILLLE